jgi:DNA (cytosine-5)-methyltransferase 1
MTPRPQLLDLFCKQGGAGKGYADAGFDVVGVDIEPQPLYPFTFIQHDALSVLRNLARDGHVLGRHFDAVHASPPCQANVKGLAAVNRTLGRAYNHVDLIAATRALLVASGKPYVIENVVGSALINPVQLCGSSFGLAVQRHRLFETNISVMAPPCAHHLQGDKKYWNATRKPGEPTHTSKVVQVYGNAGDAHLWPQAMGIDWMSTDGLREAIPPAYTEHVGHYLMAHLTTEKAA